MATPHTREDVTCTLCGIVRRDLLLDSEESTRWMRDHLATAHPDLNAAAKLGVVTIDLYGRPNSMFAFVLKA